MHGRELPQPHPLVSPALDALSHTPLPPSSPHPSLTPYFHGVCVCVCACSHRCRAPKPADAEEKIVNGRHNPWREVFDSESKRIYYFNTETNDTQVPALTLSLSLSFRKQQYPY